MIWRLFYFDVLLHYNFFPLCINYRLIHLFWAIEFLVTHKKHWMICKNWIELSWGVSSMCLEPSRVEDKFHESPFLKHFPFQLLIHTHSASTYIDDSVLRLQKLIANKFRGARFCAATLEYKFKVNYLCGTFLSMAESSIYIKEHCKFLLQDTENKNIIAHSFRLIGEFISEVKRRKFKTS